VYLSQLEILGFKSFPEKTTLEFNGDITAVVGPNGCGKTNILDSIRWVLGEQRSSLLRSSKMEEIIFNGTAQMKPLGLAEVNLTIKNNRGILPVEYDEVVITRRLYRSGESEYLLNKSQCRLKDIMELFYDTGMGPHAYSVIQQGMVDAILSDKAEDRRNLFEEAAGVTKYKHRKKEAIAKLEATRADLLRLGDIIVEIEKQVGALRRQAARARAFSRQKDELKAIELALAAGRLYESQGKRHEHEAKRGVLQTEMAAINAEFEKRELSLQESRLKMTELERQASERRQQQSDFTVNAAEIESEIKLNKHRVESARKEIGDSNAEISALNSRILELQHGADDKASKLSGVNAEKEALQASASVHETHLAEKTQEMASCEAEVNNIRARNAGIAEKISALKAEFASLSDLKQSLRQKLVDAQKDAHNIEETRSEEQNGLASLETRRATLESEIERIKAKLNDKLGEIARFENQLAQERETLAKNRAEFSGLTARQELLGQLIETGEGYSSGAKKLMAWSERPEGMLSPLADVLEAPEQYRVAASEALGNYSEIIPVKSQADAQRAIDYLKANDGGRASFLVMEKLDLAAFKFERPPNASGFLGYLDEIINYPDQFRLVANLLLGHVALFETKEAALSTDSEWDDFIKVDLDGQVFMPPAITIGGKSSTGVIGRKQDLEAVNALMTEISANIEKTDTAFGENTRALQVLKNDCSVSERNLANIEDEKRKVDAELGQMKFDFRERETRYANAVDQATAITREIDQYEQKIEQINVDLTSLETEAGRGALQLEESTSRLVELHEAVSQLEGKLTEVRIQLIEHDGMVARLRSDIEHGRELSAEAEKMIANHQANIIKAQQQIDSSQSGNEELETQLYDVFARRRDVQDRLHQIEDAITEHREGTGRMDDDLARLRKEKDRVTTALHAVEMEFLELESSRKAILERLRMEFNVSSVEPAPLPDEKSYDDIKKDADSIRQKISQMDPVNLMAAEDYEREKDRLEFLIRQRDDLIEAENSLKSAISRINATAEARFLETFSQIQNNFEQVFLTLFEGGEARLELEDDSNPLESPIRIWARPGGKRLLSVAQLSGGERALTAISLLFGIYLVKPSPFCILDEVDAPLDDANLLRFIKLIKKFADDTQFIIITHNKMTMEASSILYGVTMETPGVSKVVSVRFGDDGNGSGGNGHK
jgi:chromosome segregation protein